VNYLNGGCCCQPLSTPGTGSINYFACPSASYHAIPPYHAIPQACITLVTIVLTLWSISTQKLQVWKLVTIVDFATHFTNYLCTHNRLRANDLYQLSMRMIHLIPFQWSIAGLNIAKTTRTYKLCQGNFYLFHSFGFQQLKHMVPYSFNPFHIDSWNIKVPKTITLDNENRRRFIHMHTIFLCNFSKYASCDSPNTPFLLSRWISILVIERHSSRISFWSLRTRTSSSLTIDWHYCCHVRCHHIRTIRKLIFHSITLFKCCPLIHV
jgi:hypothetical protein